MRCCLHSGLKISGVVPALHSRRCFLVRRAQPWALIFSHKQLYQSELLTDWLHSERLVLCARQDCTSFIRHPNSATLLLICSSIASRPSICSVM